MPTGVYVRTAETRARNSAGHMGKTPWNKGIPMSAEHCARLSASHMGISHVTSPETRAKISASEKGKEISAETRAKIIQARSRQLMEPCSPEKRAKISAAMMGHTFTGLRHYTPEMCLKVSVALWRGGKKVSKAKSHSKRRTLGFTPLNSSFAGSDAHHINQSDVIYIPKAMHKSVSHNQWTGKGMAEINALAGAFLTEDWT